MKLHDMQQRRSAIATQMRQLHEEIGDNAWSDEQRTKWDGMQHETEQLDAQIDREEELRKLDSKFVESQDPEQRDQGEESTYSDAFDAFVRRGLGEMAPEHRELLREQRALAVADDGKGGHTVPDEFRNKVMETMKAYGGIASVSQLLNTDHGRTIEWPTSDGTDEMGVLIGENTQVPEGDPSFGLESIGAKKMTSKIIKVPNELLQDTAIDMTGFLTRRIGSRLGRGEASLLVNGTGTGTPLQPKGLKAATTLAQEAAANNAVAYDDVVDLIHKIDPAYRMGPQFRLAFNDSTCKTLKKLKDADGRPLWLPSVAVGELDTFAGAKYVIDQAIEDIGANGVSMYAGDFAFFLIRRVRYMTLKRLTERYADYDQTAFLAFHRFDCVLEDTAAMAKLTHAA